MKVENNQQAPDFTINDVYGSSISLNKFKGQKIHLVFYRFAGCPFCNLRFHEINKMTELYKNNNTVLISIYESSAENMRSMLADEKFYSIMIPNSDSSLYKKYALERSKWGLFKFLLFGGGLSKAKEGMKLYKNKVAIDGHTDRLEAEFLIDANGKIMNAHYSKIQGDYLAVNTIKAFVQDKN
ncbi:MAG: redoxin domain-containing protein [Bacteroidetes bacterium]|nr:redoxin domain-containing protein [Bacteroidota bacterium]